MPTLPGSFDSLSFYRTSNRFEQTNPLDLPWFKTFSLSFYRTSNRLEQTNPLDLPWSKASFEVSEDNQELNAPGSSSKGLDSDDDDDDDDEEEDGEEEQRIVGGGKIIHFQHTKKEVCTDQDFS